MDSHESETSLRSTFLWKLLQFPRFYLQEPHHILIVKSQKMTPWYLCRGRGKWTFIKYLTVKKGLLCKRKDFIRAYSTWRNGNLFFLAFLSHLRNMDGRMGRLRNISQGQSSGIFNQRILNVSLPPHLTTTPNRDPFESWKTQILSLEEYLAQSQQRKN